MATADSLSGGKMTAKAARARVVALYTKAAKETAALVKATKALGAPDVPGGTKVAAEYMSVLTDLQRAYTRAATNAGKLSTADAETLYVDLESIDNVTNEDFRSIGMPLEPLQANDDLAAIIDNNADCLDVIDAYAVEVEPTGFEVGDCVNFTTFQVVDCATKHDGEVYLTAVYPGDERAAFPGQRAVNDYVDDLCVTNFAAYVGTSYDDSSLDYTVVYPTEDSWQAGDREIICAVSGDTQLTGSARNSGQ